MSGKRILQHFVVLQILRSPAVTLTSHVMNFCLCDMLYDIIYECIIYVQAQVSLYRPREIHQQTVRPGKQLEPSKKSIHSSLIHIYSTSDRTRHKLLLCVHCYIDFCDMTLGQDHDSNQSFLVVSFICHVAFLIFLCV